MLTLVYLLSLLRRWRLIHQSSVCWHDLPLAKTSSIWPWSTCPLEKLSFEFVHGKNAASLICKKRLFFPLEVSARSCHWKASYCRGVSTEFWCETSMRQYSHIMLFCRHCLFLRQTRDPVRVSQYSCWCSNEEAYGLLTLMIVFWQAQFVQGDFRDKALMGISLVIFCIIGAQMYSLYAYWYCSMGLHPVLRGWEEYFLWCVPLALNIASALYRLCGISNFERRKFLEWDFNQAWWSSEEHCWGWVATNVEWELCAPRIG